MRPWFTNRVAVTRGSFRIEYDGPALEDHRIDVRQLAPALIGLADAVAVAHLATSDGSTLPPALEIGPPSEGSFLAELSLVWDSVVDLFNTPDVDAITNAKELIGTVIGGVLWIVYRKRNGGKEQEDIQGTAPGKLVIRYPNGASLETTAQAQRLVDNMEFHRAMLDATEPLRYEGVDSFEIRHSHDAESDAETVTVTPDDRVAFNQAPQDESILSDNQRIVTLEVVKPDFGNNKWRVTDGTGPFWVTVQDPVFQRAIANREIRFGAGDRLDVELRDMQIDDNGKLRAEHVITRVVAHRVTPPEDTLDFGDGAE